MFQFFFPASEFEAKAGFGVRCDQVLKHNTASSLWVIMNRKASKCGYIEFRLWMLGSDTRSVVCMVLWISCLMTNMQYANAVSKPGQVYDVTAFHKKHPGGPGCESRV